MEKYKSFKINQDIHKPSKVETVFGISQLEILVMSLDYESVASSSAWACLPVLTFKTVVFV